MCDFLLLVVRVYCSVASGRFSFIILGSGSDVYGGQQRSNRGRTGVKNSLLTAYIWGEIGAYKGSTKVL